MHNHDASDIALLKFGLSLTPTIGCFVLWFLLFIIVKTIRKGLRDDIKETDSSELSVWLRNYDVWILYVPAAAILAVFTVASFGIIAVGYRIIHATH